jgi:hypothetical protein
MGNEDVRHATIDVQLNHARFLRFRGEEGPEIQSFYISELRFHFWGLISSGINTRFFGKSHFSFLARTFPKIREMQTPLTLIVVQKLTTSSSGDDLPLLLILENCSLHLKHNITLTANVEVWKMPSLSFGARKYYLGLHIQSIQK